MGLRHPVVSRVVLTHGTHEWNQIRSAKSEQVRSAKLVYSSIPGNRNHGF